ncbi:hypothetical protein IFM89_031474 [Coptis chinensis]|uniref:DUF4283 domain-containing protein n=1 Tax=Coptis chinensis TaxID=261450 RepID=A0A835HGV6_9MAGN|nr:hypothetical protein IFM89_031474 [Coptis chinensis]
MAASLALPMDGGAISSVAPSPNVACSCMGKDKPQLESFKSSYKIETRDGYPMISFASQDMTKAIACLKNTLIIKFFFKKPSIDEIRISVRQTWGLKSEVIINVIDSKHILLKFADEEDVVKALARKNPHIEGCRYKISRWSHQFDPTQDSALAPVWVEFYDLPYHLFNPGMLIPIASMIGKYLTIDQATLTMSTPLVARICVEIDLSKPLPSKLKITDPIYMDFWQEVVYDKLPRYCTYCSLQGHNASDCRKLNPNGSATRGELVHDTAHINHVGPSTHARKQNRILDKQMKEQSEKNKSFLSNQNGGDFFYHSSAELQQDVRREHIMNDKTPPSQNHVNIGASLGADKVLDGLETPSNWAATSADGQNGLKNNLAAEIYHDSETILVDDSSFIEETRVGHVSQGKLEVDPKKGTSVRRQKNTLLVTQTSDLPPVVFPIFSPTYVHDGGGNLVSPSTVKETHSSASGTRVSSVSGAEVEKWTRSCCGDLEEQESLSNENLFLELRAIKKGDKEAFSKAIAKAKENRLRAYGRSP